MYSYEYTAQEKHRYVKFKLFCLLPNIEVFVILYPFQFNKLIWLTCTSGPTANAEVLHISQCSPECLQPKQFSDYSVFISYYYSHKDKEVKMLTLKG
jgi:hypothetical protein